MLLLTDVRYGYIKGYNDLGGGKKTFNISCSIKADVESFSAGKKKNIRSVVEWRERNVWREIGSISGRHAQSGAREIITRLWHQGAASDFLGHQTAARNDGIRNFSTNQRGWRNQEKEINSLYCVDWKSAHHQSQPITRFSASADWIGRPLISILLTFF